jgi:hypothetical protein
MPSFQCLLWSRLLYGVVEAPGQVRGTERSLRSAWHNPAVIVERDVPVKMKDPAICKAARI